MLISIALLLASVLLLARMRRIYPRRAATVPQIEPDGTVFLLVFSAVFLAVTVIAGSIGDYGAYLIQWDSILNGHNPWEVSHRPFNAYGPLFTALAPAILFSPLTAKLLCAFCYIAFSIWLTIRFYKTKTRWFWLGLLFFNIFPWEQIAAYGYFDVLVGASCVACLHSLKNKKDGAAGLYLAFGVLLKFLPIVILPFVAIRGSRVNYRLGVVCASLVFLGFFVCLILWGTSTFKPLVFAANRQLVFSIYSLLNANHSPFRFVMPFPHPDWFEKPLILSSLLLAFFYCRKYHVTEVFSAVFAILVTLIFYRATCPNYQMVLFMVLAYWAVSEWTGLRQHPFLGLFLIGYFDLMAVADYLDFWQSNQRSVLHSGFVILMQFLLGTSLLIGLIRVALLSPPEPELGVPR